MTEIELLGKILLSVRFIRYTLFIFIGRRMAARSGDRVPI